MMVNSQVAVCAMARRREPLSLLSKHLQLQGGWSLIASYAGSAVSLRV